MARTGGGDLRRTLRLFARFTVGQRRAFLYATMLLAIEAVTAVAVPDLIKNLTDFLSADQLPSVLGFTPSAEAAIPVIAGGIVAATATEVLRPGRKEVLALQACHPRFFASHRWIAYATPVKVTPRGGTAFRPVESLAAAA